MPNLHSIPALQHDQSPIQRLLAVTTSIDEFASQSRQTSAPANRQTSTQLVLDFTHLLHEVTAALAFTLGDGVHGAGEKEADCFVDVCFGSDGREAEFCERFGDTDNGFQLTHSDGDGAPCVGGEFGGVHLPADGDEVGGKFLGCFV